jgi:hypothetical protein
MGGQRLHRADRTYAGEFLNRRAFLSTLIAAGVGAAIDPERQRERGDSV